MAGQVGQRRAVAVGARVVGGARRSRRPRRRRRARRAGRSIVRGEHRLGRGADHAARQDARLPRAPGPDFVLGIIARGRAHRRRRAGRARGAARSAAASRPALCCSASPWSRRSPGILHWIESWLAHDVAYRLLADMRIAAFPQARRAGPAYLTRRRTGDLVGVATHDVELIEYFFAHTVTPALVAVLIPLGVLAVLGGIRVAAGAGARAVPRVLRAACRCWPRARIDRLGSRGARGLRRPGRARGGHGAGHRRDRRLRARAARGARRSRPRRGASPSCGCRSSTTSPCRPGCRRSPPASAAWRSSLAGAVARGARAARRGGSCRCSPCWRCRPSCRCGRSRRWAASSPTHWAPLGGSTRLKPSPSP